LGYDIAKGVGGNRLEVVEISPTKTVPYTKYKDALDRIVALETELAKLKEDKGKGKEGSK